MRSSHVLCLLHPQALVQVRHAVHMIPLPNPTTNTTPAAALARTRARAAALENALLLQRDALLSLGMMSFVPVRCYVMWLCNQPEGTIELEHIGFFGVGETPASALDSSASAACGL